MGNIFTQIWQMEDLRKRVLFVLAMLAVFRMGIFVPLPGVDRDALGNMLNLGDGGGGDRSLFDIYNMFTGGALEMFSIFVLGIMPYITAAIIMNLLVVMVPALERIKKEGQQGQNRITQYTRYMTIGIAVVQSFFMSIGLEQMVDTAGPVVTDPGWSFRLMTVLTITAGSCFVMWLGEQITERGIGNGASIIITAGIIAAIPMGVSQLYTLVDLGQINLLQAALILVFIFALVAGVVFVERAQRRIPIQYAKRVLGRRVYEGQTTHLPLKVNAAGVIPPIFASALLMLPATMGTFADNQLLEWLQTAFMPGNWLYNIVFGAMVIFFAFFYTAVTFNPVDVAENLKKQGGYIPRIRPGKDTAEYIDWLMSRLTTGGSIYLAIVCLMPMLAGPEYGILMILGGTGLIILVSVSLDTVSQIEAQLMTRHYDGLTGPKGEKIKGRRRMMGGSGLPGGGGGSQPPPAM